jgi:uncharacterized protein with PQ loop repeat
VSPGALFGVLAGVSGTLFAFAPLLQLQRVRRHGSAEQVSAGFFAALLVNVSLWLAYGLATGDPPIVIANAIGVATALVTLAVVLRYRRAVPVS